MNKMEKGRRGAGSREVSPSARIVEHPIVSTQGKR